MNTIAKLETVPRIAISGVGFDTTNRFNINMVCKNFESCEAEGSDEMR